MTVPKNSKQRQSNWKMITQRGRFKTFKRFCFWLVTGNCVLYILHLHPAFWLFQRQTEDWADFSQYYQNTFQRQPPKGLERWLKYAQQQKCGTRGHHYETLDRDLEFFRGQIQLRGRALDLEQVIPMGKNITKFYIAFSLENHKLTIEEYHGKGWGFQWEPIQWEYTKALLRANLEPIRKHKPPIKTKFIINLYDKAQDASAHATYPVFSYCKQDFYTNDKPIPPGIIDHGHSVEIDRAIHKGTNPQEFVASRDLLIPARSSLQPERLDMWFWPFYRRGPPFHSRQNRINWRGATTGDWGNGPRFHLMSKFGGTDIHPLGNASGVFADFAFTRNIQQPQEAEPAENGYRFTGHMFYWELQRMKYILDVDGNGFTGRFPGLLRTGSLVFKSSRYREWFTGALEPFKHYIPVNYDLSDLEEKVAWVHSHPQVAERIAAASRKLAETRFRRQDIKCYTYRLLLEYQTLFEEQ